VRVELCPNCYRELERVPLAWVRRILAACPTCRKLLIPLARREAQQLLQASIVADAIGNLQQTKRQKQRRRGP
jgi:Zn-finger nucleic acid-binding protein